VAVSPVPGVTVVIAPAWLNSRVSRVPAPVAPKVSVVVGVVVPPGGSEAFACG
jgi:hypothetical protein